MVKLPPHNKGAIMRKYRKSLNVGFKFCNRCDAELEINDRNFVKDSSRSDGFSYECKKCHSKRKKGRDRRKERWSNMTDEQKERKRSMSKKYAETLKGRAIFLKKSYKRMDECDLTTEEIMLIISKPCEHCGTTDLKRGLDRIDNRLPHVRGNVAPSCLPCNFARGDRFTFDEMKKIGSVIRQVLKDRNPSSTGNEGRPE